MDIFTHLGSIRQTGELETVADVKQYFVGLVDTSVSTLNLPVSQVPARWLAGVLADLSDPNKALRPLSRGETVTDLVIEARKKADPQKLAEAGKVSLLAAGGLGRRSKLNGSEFYQQMAQGAFWTLGAVAPWMDAELAVIRDQGLIIDGDALGSSISAWSPIAPSESVMTQVADEVPQLTRVLAVINKLCVEGSTLAAWEALSGKNRSGTA